MNEPEYRPTLMATASEWSLFQAAFGEGCQVSEKDFRRLPIQERLRLLMNRVGKEPIVEEINATLRRLRASHEYGQGGFDCAFQRDWRGITMGWLVNPYDDPVFRTIDPCRVLPSLIRLEKRIETNPDDFDFYERCKQVRRIISRTNSGT